MNEYAVTIQGLIDHLTKCVESDPTMATVPVYLAEDAEGNGYRSTDGDFDLVLAEELGLDEFQGVGTRVEVMYPNW